MPPLHLRVTRRLRQALAWLAATVIGRDTAGCCDCGEDSVLMVTFDPLAGVDSHGVPFPKVWTFCAACTEKLLSDEGRLVHRYLDGVLWAMLDEPVTGPALSEETMADLEAHALPFLPPSSVLA